MRNRRTVGFHPEDLAGEYSLTGYFKNPRSALRTAMILLTPGRLLSASKDGESSEYLFERSDYSYIVIVQSNIS
jgi:hypothetical protein